MDGARSEFSFWWQALGVITGSLSLISFTQKVFDIGLAGTFAAFVEYYRAVFYPLLQPIYAALAFILPFDLPDWYKDAYLLSVILFAPLMRTVTMQQAREGDGIFTVTAASVSLTLGASLVLLGLYIPFLVIKAFVEDDDDDQGTYRKISVSLLCILAAAILFFALNYQLG
jgi:hypothetical protein